MIRRLIVTLGLFVAALIVVVLVWVASWALPPRAPADGMTQIRAPGGVATIVRDERGIPYIHALSVEDAFFAQGYAVAQDRLFQMDLLRRSVAGELSEVFGKIALSADEEARLMRPRAIAHQGYLKMSAADRRLLDAFTLGVNAQMQRGPLPPEFRLLGYRPRPWTGDDSVLAGLATVLDLTNKWDAILRRARVNDRIGAAASDRLNLLSDTYYDAPLIGKIAPHPCRAPAIQKSAAMNGRDYITNDGDFNSAAVEASNNWAVGAQHTTTGRAIVANDPHLNYHVPGVWYLIELQAPGLHVSGASLAGIPGVILGHTDGLAWGVTNATVSTVTVYREPLAAVRATGADSIAVRFGKPVTLAHKSTRHGFVFASDDRAAYSAQWVATLVPSSPLDTFFALDRANTIERGLAALARYPGPPQNFVLGDASGRVAYHMAGFIPIDGVFSTGVVDGARVRNAWRGFVAFDQLPHVDPSRGAIVFTANNRVVGSDYPYRLTDQWTPAYRARRIAGELATKRRFSIDDMRRMQLDVVSLADREFARLLAAYLSGKRNATARERSIARTLARWDGRMTPESATATLVWQLRRAAAKRYAELVLGEGLGREWAGRGDGKATEVLLCGMRSHTIDFGRLGLDMPAENLPPWYDAGRTLLEHPLHALGITLFDAAPLPGHGDFASVSVKTEVLGQSFRAVWDVGGWRSGGIIIPLGESGLMRTRHATDQEADYIAGRLHSL